MPIDRGPDEASTGAALLHRRRSERRSCNIIVSLITRDGVGSARLTDLSAGGAGFTADPLLAIRPGAKVSLSHEKLGEVHCIVRWAAPPRYGVEFEHSGRPQPRLVGFYDSLPPATGQAF